VKWLAKKPVEMGYSAATKVVGAVGYVAETVVDVLEVTGKVASTVGKLATGKPVEWMHTKGWDVFGYNWDPVRKVPSQPSIILESGQYQAGLAKTLFTVSCENCYAHMSAGFKFYLSMQAMTKMPYCQVNSLLVEVFGDMKMNAHILAQVTSRVETYVVQEVGKQLSMGTIVIPAPVPISISAYVSLKVAARLTAEAAGTVTVGFDYTRSMRQGIKYRSQWEEVRPIPPETVSKFNPHPLKVRVGGRATLQAELMPRLTLKLWQVSPVYMEPNGYVGVDVAMGEGSGCGSPVALGYDMFYGLDLRLGMDPLQINVPLFAEPFTFGGSMLPIEKKLALVNKWYPQIPQTKGCLDVAGAITAAVSGAIGSTASSSPSSGAAAAGGQPSGLVQVQWVLSSWSPCSATCGGGTQERTATCYLRAPLFDPVATSSSTCTAQLGDPPPSSQPCNTHSCSVTIPCPLACMPGMLRDGFCDPECNVAACDFDGGDCDEQIALANACSEATTCDECLMSGLGCGWCVTTSRCFLDSSQGPADQSQCLLSSWYTTQCAPAEPRLTMTLPSGAAMLKAGKTYSVSWTGGPAAPGMIRLRLRLDNSPTVFSGYGLPAEPIENTNSFIWKVAAGIPSSIVYQMLVSSEEDLTNFDLSDGYFAVDGVLGAFEWRVSEWTRCSKICRGGSRTRVVACVRSVTNTEVIASNCNSASRPATSESCNTIACVSKCPYVVPPGQYEWDPFSCQRQSDKRGFFCGTWLTEWSSGWSMVTGCDTNDNGYQHCCREQG
jgi:hypothetical protein